MTRTALLLAVLTTPLLVTAGEGRKPSSESLKERWKLRLMPEKAPEIAGLLGGTVWVQDNIIKRNRFGEGEDYALRFEVPKDSGGFGSGQPWVRFTTIRNQLGNGLDGGPGSSSSERKTTVVDHATWTRTETMRTYKLVIDKSFLEFNGLIHTAVVIKDKQLILDAGIPVGAGKWYRVSSWRGSDGGISVTEYLLEFQDDPLRTQEGKAVVHVNTRTEPKGGAEYHIRVPATFKLNEKKEADGRWFYFRRDTKDGPNYRLPEVGFKEGRDYIELDEPAKVYEARKISKQAEQKNGQRERPDERGLPSIRPPSRP